MRNFQDTILISSNLHYLTFKQELCLWQKSLILTVTDFNYNNHFFNCVTFFTYKRLKHAQLKWLSSLFSSTSYLSSFLTDIKSFIYFVTNQHCVIKTCAMFTQVLSDRSSNYLRN